MKCIRCGIGQPRLSTTLCDRCLRTWVRRQQDRKRDKHKKDRGICVSWGDAEWRAHHAAVIEYLTQLERTAEKKAHDE